MYWRLSFYELISRVKLKVGELNARMLCQYTAFAEVVNAALGGSKQSSGHPQKGEFNDLAQGPSFEAAIANINRALNFG